MTETPAKPTLMTAAAKVRVLMAGHELSALFLLILMLLAALSESLGLSLVLPLMSKLIGGESGLGAASAEIDAAIDRILGFLPASPSMEVLLLILFVAFFAKGVLLIATRTLGTYFALRLREDWAARIFGHYLHAGDPYLARQRDGRMIHNVVTETHHASRGVVKMLNFVNRLILATLLFIIMLMAHWQATVAIMFFSLILVFLVRASSARYSIRYGERRMKLGQDVSDIAAEGMHNVRTIKLTDAYGRFGSNLLDKLRRYSKTDALFILVSELPLQMTEVSMVTLLAVTMLALRDVFDVDLKGATVLLGFFIVIFQRLMTYVSYLMSQRMKVAGDVPALTLVHDLITNAPSREQLDDGEEIPSLDADIEFDQVDFDYDDGTKVFSNLNLMLKRGKTTAITGPSGVGKSTVADLLLGFQQPVGGTIRIAGRPVGEYALSSLRRRIGYVAQDLQIFNSSIRDNIALGNPGASKQEIIAAAKTAHAHEFIERLPDGYDTVVGNKGVSLSGGQRQRLVIARVIVAKPELYVFDEATSALDGRSEKFIRESMRELARDATVVVIAHRPSTIESADVIYRLDGNGGAKIVSLDEVLPEMTASGRT